VAAETGRDQADAAKLLEMCGWNVREAIERLKTTAKGETDLGG
jgi:hypothetical protein